MLAMLALAGIMYGLWQKPMRISHIVMYGTDQSLAAIAEAALQGSSFGVPNDSIFFIPESRVRATLMAEDPNIAAVSIFKNGLAGLSIKVDYRDAIAHWCGATPPVTSSSTEMARSDLATCYVFDANGYIYSASATSTKTINAFDLYAPLASGASEPLRAMLAHAEQFPAVFDFARKLATFGSPVVKVVLQGDEVDDYLASGTRVEYVLGEEENAFTALASARKNFSLADGAIDYIDLRFPGKVYMKKK